MKVLLRRDVEKLGWVGDIVEVSDGYARNYLLPQRLGLVATDENTKTLAQAKAKRAEEIRVARETAEKLASSVGEAEAVIAAKANEQGHLFGSVGAREIAANLREQGFEVPDEAVLMSEHIKEVGAHEVEIALKRPADGQFVADLTATVRVTVVAKDKPVEPTDADSQE